MTFWTQPKQNSRFHAGSVRGFKRWSDGELDILLTHNRVLTWKKPKKLLDRLQAQLVWIVKRNKESKL